MSSNTSSRRRGSLALALGVGLIALATGVPTFAESAPLPAAAPQVTGNARVDELLTR